jgi:hypothetical protein
MKQQTIQGLTKEQCAYHENNYNGHLNFCLTGECPDNKCIYFYDSKDDYYFIRCKYFEECVLPLDKQLEAIYYAKIEAEKNKKQLTNKEIEEIKIKNKVTIECLKCKKEFKPTSNRQKYCNKCKKDNQKDNQKEWIKNKRKVHVDVDL